jgi:flagellar biosynthesis/type III secretory pathway protein FliH
MERIASADERIVALSAVLTRPTPVRETAAAEPAPVDPRVAFEAERRRGLDAAHDEGRAEGLREAEAIIEQRAADAERRVRDEHATETQRLADARERLARLLRAVPDAVADFEAELDSVTVEAAYAATTRVLGELAVERTLVVRMCEQVLSEFRQRPAVLRVALDDVAALQELADADELRVVGDAALAPGECRIETAKGRYQSGLATRLDAIKQAFLASIEQAGART